MAALIEGDADEDASKIERRVNDGVQALERCSNIIRSSTVWPPAMQHSTKGLFGCHCTRVLADAILLNKSW